MRVEKRSVLGWNKSVSKSVSELKLVLGLCCIYNLFVDLLQEAPSFFASLLKSDSDSGVNQTEKKIYTWGKPLQNSGCSLKLVKLIKYTKNLGEGTPCKILVVIFSCAAFVGLPKESKSSLKKRAT